MAILLTGFEISGRPLPNGK